MLAIRCAQARRPGAGVVATLFAWLVEPGTRVLVHITSTNKKATARVAFSLFGGGAEIEPNAIYVYFFMQISIFTS